MVKEYWNYDKNSHRVIIDVKKDWYSRNRRGRGSSVSSNILNRPRLFVLGVILIILIFTFLKEARFVLASNVQFRIKNIIIENTQLINDKALLQIINSKVNSDNLFGVSAKSLARKLEEDPDIKIAVVEKQFPDTLRVIINERISYVKVKQEAKEYLLDNNGVVLLRERDENVSVPVIIGVKESEMTPGKVCNDPFVQGALNILKLGEKCTWNRFLEILSVDMRNTNNITIETRERILILLNQENLEPKLEKLMEILSDSEKKEKMISRIDLRYKDVYVK